MKNSNKKIEKDIKAETSNSSIKKSTNNLIGKIKTNPLSIGTSKILEKNSSIKIIAAVIAIILWLYVSVYVDPTKPQNIYGIPIQIDEDSPALKNFDLMPINFNSQTVNITIFGDRSEVVDLKSDDFIATLDLSRVTGAGVYNLQVDVKNADPNASFEILEISPKEISIEFDHKNKKTFSISPSESMDIVTVSDDYIKGEYQISPQEVQVTGPDKELEKIEYVEVEVPSDIPTSIEDSYTLKGEIILKDALGNTIESDMLVKNKDEATITIPVQKMKTIELVVGFTDLPPNMYEDMIKYELSTSTIRVTGEKAIIEKLADQYTIGYTSLSKLDLESEKEISIELPSGVKDYDNVSSVTMKLNMPNLVKQTFTSDQIKISNYPSGYSVTSDISILSNIEIIGDYDTLEKISGSDIIVYVNMSDKEIIPGKSYKKAKIILPDIGVAWAVDPKDGYYQVPVQITKIESVK